MDERARDRFSASNVAMRYRWPLPPIEVYKWRSDYFVIDGLHRVAVARALGHQYHRCRGHRPHRLTIPARARRARTMRASHLESAAHRHLRTW